MPSFENSAMKTFVSMWLNKPGRVRLFASKILNESLFQNVKAINNTNNLAQNMPTFTDNFPRSNGQTFTRFKLTELSTKSKLINFFIWVNFCELKTANVLKIRHKKDCLNKFESQITLNTRIKQCISSKY